MLETINGFLDSELWDMSQRLALAGGISGLIGLLLPIRRGPRKALIWGGLGLLFASIVFSMIFEDLLPTLSTLPEHRRLLYALGFPGHLAGISMIVYGGWRFVRTSLPVVEGFGRQGQGAPRSGHPSTAQDRFAPPDNLLRLWLPGLAWMGGGFALIVFSASMQHADHFPLGRLWALFGAGP